MTESAPLETILRLCAAAAPVPWYPLRATADLGLTDDDLTAFVEQLRGGGLLARTDAVPGYGRGYVLTPLGVQALQDPGDLEWLRRGEIPPRKSAPPEGEPPAVPAQERAVRMSLLAPFTAYVTYGLIALNVAVFLWGVQMGRQKGLPLGVFIRVPPEDIMRASGAVKATDVVQPGWGLLRLLTCCVVHFGLIHLAVNMVSLHLVGPLLERMWGHVRFLILYLIAGLGGSCVAMVLRPFGPGGQPVLLAGASGALWGLLTAMAVWVVLNFRHLPRRLFSTWGIQIAIAFAINIGLTYLVPGISAEAHYGGGAVGAVCAVLLQATRFGPGVIRAIAAVGVAALPAFGFWAVTHPARFNPQWQGQEKPLLERKKADEKDREMVDFQDHVLGDVKQREQAALQHVPDATADPIFNRNPGRRDEGQVKRAIAAYGEAEAALRPAADLLRRSGPYPDADVEKTRLTWLESVEARLDLLTQNKRCLEVGKEWSHKDEEQRLKAVEQVGKLEKERER